MPATEQNKPRILIVDEDISIQKLLAHALQIYGLEVLTANQGRMAIEVFNRHQNEIDLVLLDVRTPMSEGLGTLAALRRIEPAAKVALMSAYAGGFTAAELSSLGVVRVFEKPFLSLKHLAWALKEIVERTNRSE
jgi:two-component system cell cycle sensor histidine kinase/response regulator CckA